MSKNKALSICIIPYLLRCHCIHNYYIAWIFHVPLLALLLFSTISFTMHPFVRMVYALECQSDTYGIWLKLNLKPGLCKTKGRRVIEGNNKYMEILKMFQSEKQKFTDMCGWNTLTYCQCSFLYWNMTIVCKKPLNLKDVFELKLW